MAVGPALNVAGALGYNYSHAGSWIVTGVGVSVRLATAIQLVREAAAQQQQRLNALRNFVNAGPAED
jgi:hypothetical protein